MRMQLSGLDQKQAGRSTGEHSAVARLVEPEKRDIREMQGFVDTLEPLTGAMEQSAIRRRPDISLPILEHGANEFVGQSLLRAEGAKTAILVMQQSSAVRRGP